MCIMGKLYFIKHEEIVRIVISITFTQTALPSQRCDTRLQMMFLKDNISSWILHNFMEKVHIQTCMCVKRRLTSV